MGGSRDSLYLNGVTGSFDQRVVVFGTKTAGLQVMCSSIPNQTSNTSDVLIYFSAVNSEANARRIALVEGCFGTSGQPLGVPGKVDLKSLLSFPAGRVLVGEGVLTKACRKKPKPRYCILYRTVSCICVSKALNVPQTGNSSSSMICLSMETL